MTSIGQANAPRQNPRDHMDVEFYYVRNFDTEIGIHFVTPYSFQWQL